MEQPYMLNMGKLVDDLKEVFVKHGWSEEDAKELASMAVKAALTAN